MDNPSSTSNNSLGPALARRALSTFYGGGGHTVGLQLQEIAHRYQTDYRNRAAHSDVGQRLRQIADRFESNPAANEADRTTVIDVIVSSLLSALSHQVQQTDALALIVQPSNWASLGDVRHILTSFLRERTSAFLVDFARDVARRLIAMSLNQLMAFLERNGLLDLRYLVEQSSNSTTSADEPSDRLADEAPADDLDEAETLTDEDEDVFLSNSSSTPPGSPAWYQRRQNSAFIDLVRTPQSRRAARLS